jgi:single-stranded-DNA-specific exonuclease
MQPQWSMREIHVADAAALERALHCSPLVARLLVGRGITEPELARRFLEPRLSDLLSPTLLSGMEAAVARILAAIHDRQVICVWGDYDVDGVTSTVQLVTFFRAIAYPVRYFVPDRFQHGYGLTAGPLEQLAAEGVQLVITVDCGISSAREVALARGLGVDVVVVDHHEPPAEPPAAAAVIDPLLPTCDYPYKKMAACGLTFHLLIALRAALREHGYFSASVREPDLRQWLDLVAIGTVADVVPLTGVNRVLTATGLKVIAQGGRPGVRALCAVAGADPAAVRASTIGFQLGPRINAAGRLSHAAKGVELLLSQDYEEALEGARAVDEENRRRRSIEAAMLDEALAQAESEGDPRHKRALVLARDNWHPGVAGIVASKVVERYHRPTLVIALDQGLGKGSARSIPGFHWVQALGQCAHLLRGFGGHAHAAGVTVDAARVPELALALDDEARRALSDDDLVPTIVVDAELSLAMVSADLIAEIDVLAPFGMGNARPLFASAGCTVRQSRVVGTGHLSLELEQDGAVHRAIGFRMAEQQPPPGAKVDVAFYPELNTFRGETSVQLRLRDLRPR